ncbi:FG-GAP-like repeat-containing protein [Streptomyces showdoensis]|uniref:FG-GAP-like repeat-containing protein n=1 Tax=Streptomyces showdoensis TaxID=68268 RepID=UPI0013F4C50A|nr:FG-GAP-like repeat-containing protein [Streptomyces showdoensis]
MTTGRVSEEDYALEQAATTGQPFELESARTETTDTWAQPDGKWIVKQHGTSVRMLRNNAWIPTDPTLEFTADGQVASKATAITVSFSGGGDGPLLTGVKDGRTLSLTWPKPLPRPVLAENVATYAEVLPGVDLQLKADVEGFSQLLVVKTAQAAQNPELAALRFKLDTVGLDVATDPDTGSVTAVNPADQVVFTSPSPMMWDSTTVSSGTTPAARTAFSASAADEGAADDAFEPAPGAQDALMPTTVTGDSLEIKPDQQLLTGADTQYPVFIDPSWTWGKQQNWTRVYRSYPNTSFWNTKEVVRVGYEDDTKGLSRSFFQLDTDEIGGSQVLKSTFRIKNTWSWQCGKKTPVQIWHVGPISPKTTWNNQPARIGTDPLFTVYDEKGWGPCAPGNLEFDVTSKVREAAAKNWASLNLGLYAGDEGDTNGWKKFDAKTAVLETEYNFPPKAPTGLGTNPRTTCATGGAIPNVHVSLFARVDDRDAGNLTAEFQVFKSGTTTPVVATTIPALKGRVATLAVPDASLPTGAYTWKVRSKDQDNAYSPWSSTCKFSVDRTVPGNPPGITSYLYPPGNDGWPENTGFRGSPGQFFLTPNGVPDVDHYVYETSWGDRGDAPAVKDDPDTKDVDESQVPVTLTPRSAGPHFVYAYSVDAAGNRSPSASYLMYANSKRTEDIANDLTGDDFRDIWTLDSNNGLLTYAGYGNGRFSKALGGGVTVQSGGQVVTGGTWNQSGTNDLVSLEPDPNGNQAKKLWVYRNLGYGVVDKDPVQLTVRCTQPDGVNCPTSNNHWSNAEQIVSAEVNGDRDGDIDLLVKQGKHLWAYVTPTHGEKLAIPTLVGGDDWDQFTVISPGDTNGDSVPDLWLRNNVTGDLFRTLGKKAEGRLDLATWGVPSQRVKIGSGLKAADFPTISSSGDFNADGIADLWARKADNSVVAWLGKVPGADGNAFGPAYSVNQALPPGVAGGTPGKSDMNGDMKADLVVHNTNGTVSVHRQTFGTDSKPKFEDTGTAVSWGWNWYRGGKDDLGAKQGLLYFADINGDGTKDLVSHGTDGRIIVRRNDRAGTGFDTGTLMSAKWGNFLGQPEEPGRLYFADVTGDNKADLIVHDKLGDVSVRKNMGTYFDSGTIMTQHWSNFLGQPGQGRLYFADITGDNKADLIVHDTAGNVSVRKNMGTYFDAGTIMTQYWSNFLGQAGQGRLYFADANADGKADLVVHDIYGDVNIRKNMGTYFDGGSPSPYSQGWASYLRQDKQGVLYFG